MPDVSMQWHGTVALRGALDRAAHQLGDLGPINERAAQVVATLARSMAPRRSGRLASSIRAQGDAGRGTIASDLVYAGVIHWGWPAHNIRANPFVLRAASVAQDRWVGAYEDGLQQICNAVEAQATGTGP